MAATPDELFRFLDRLGIAHATVSHPALFTVEQSQALRGKVPGAHSKNLFLRDKKGALFLLSTLEDAAIGLKSLHRSVAAGGRLSFGSAELLTETLGVEPGAVTPFGALNDHDCRVSILLDADLMRNETVNFHSPAQHHDDLHRICRARQVPGGNRAFSAHPADGRNQASGIRKDQA